MKRKRIPVPLQGGKTAWLDRLTPRMIIEISDDMWHDRRQRMIDNFNAAEISSSDRVAALASFDEERGKYSYILRHACTVNGAYDILKKASESKSAENATDLVNTCALDTQSAVVVACQLVGYDDSDETESENSAKKNAENSDHSG
jgi:hypothetical protein